MPQEQEDKSGTLPGTRRGTGKEEGNWKNTRVGEHVWPIYGKHNEAHKPECGHVCYWTKTIYLSRGTPWLDTVKHRSATGKGTGKGTGRELEGNKTLQIVEGNWKGNWEGNWKGTGRELGKRKGTGKTQETETSATSAPS